MAANVSSDNSESLSRTSDPRPTIYRILLAISFVHLCNDMIQAVIPGILPVLQERMSLSYPQIGWAMFTINLTASVMQPVVGIFTDRRPSPYLLPLGMTASFTGMVLLAFAPSYALILCSVIMVGLGSAVFHPEGSRVAHLAAGARKGFAQSIFQVGGNTGQSFAPVTTKWIFIPLAQIGALLFAGVAAIGIFVQLYIAKWYKGVLLEGMAQSERNMTRASNPERRKQLLFAISLLILLVFVRSWYHAAMTNYFVYYLRDVYGLKIEDSQIYLFLFLAAGAVGTLLGGPLSDRFGKRNLIFFSMIGSAPLAIIIPHAGLGWLYVMMLVNGFIILSSFSVTVIYAQALYPGKVGLVSGLIIGLAFGLGGLGSVVLGYLIDHWGITLIMELCGFLPLLGVLTFMLPSDRKLTGWSNGS